MAISDSAKVDLLYKKFFGAAKTDTPANKGVGNEGIASPALNRIDKAWVYADYIPSTPPTTTDSYVQVYTGAARIECTPDTSTTPIAVTGGSVYPTWKTSLTNWIPPEFGSLYFVKVYIAPTGTSGGTQIADSGSGGIGEWLFDYQAGTLNFIGGTIPTYLAANRTYKVFIEGYRYVSGVGATPLFNNAESANTLVSRGSLLEFASGRFTNYNGASFDITGTNNVKIQSYSSGGLTGVITVTNATAPNGYATYTVSSTANLNIGMKVNVSGISGGTSYGNFSETTSGITITNLVGNVVTTDNPITVSGTPTYTSASMYNVSSDNYAPSFEIKRDAVSVFNVTSGSIYLGGNLYAGTASFSSAVTISPGGTALSFTNSTSNRIRFPGGVTALSAPTFTSYSNGVRIVFYDSVGAGNAGHAMGVESGALWFGLANTNDTFKWYAGTTQLASLSGAGVLTAGTTATGVAPSTPSGNFSVGTTGKYFVASSSSTGRIYFPPSNPIGREITVVSSSSSSIAHTSYNASYTTPVANILARASTTLGSTITNSSLGAWATLVCIDGTNWQVVASSA